MKPLRAALGLAIALGTLLGSGPFAPVVAADVEFDAPSARAELGEPVVFETTFRTPLEPVRVDAIISSPSVDAVSVLAADVTGSGGEWHATAVIEGHTTPNTRFSYRFRVRYAGGEIIGPAAEVTVVDPRFEWQTIEGAILRLHWYAGGDDFARRALEIGERAIARAEELLGVREEEPIDFFIYSSEPDLRVALGPGTRENVAGQAHAEIRTMLVLIAPHEVNSDTVDVLVAHELTHLVFDTATSNPYRPPPRWLNEGVAVYLSEGFREGRRAEVAASARDGSLIPLDGLRGLFPTTFREFHLAYGISVSAVDFFVATHGEPVLWQLVRSYADGLSDDEAFEAATGEDFATFNVQWMASLGAPVPSPFGPRPAPPGPVPADWSGQPPPPPVVDEPVSAADPLALIAVIVVVLPLALAVLLLWVRQRGRGRRSGQPPLPR